MRVLFRVVLVDGQPRVSLMIEHGVDVCYCHVKIAQLDSEYLEEGQVNAFSKSLLLLHAAHDSYPNRPDTTCKHGR